MQSRRVLYCLEEPQNANRRRYLFYSMSAVRASGEAVLTTENDGDASNAPRAPTGANSASSKTECTPENPLSGDTPLER